MTRVNSSTPFALNEKRNLLKQNTFEFGTDVICCLVDPFIQQRNQSHLAPSIKQKIAVVLIRCSFRVPPLHHQRELMLEIFQQRVKRGQDATCLLNSYQQIIIRNPYLEPNHFAKLGVNTRTQNI